MKLVFPGMALFLAWAGYSSVAFAQPTRVCSVGQPCPNGVTVPFPVINSAQGLNNVLTYPQRNSGQQPPPSAGYAPIAIPPATPVPSSP